MSNRWHRTVEVEQKLIVEKVFLGGSSRFVLKLCFSKERREFKENIGKSNFTEKLLLSF